MTFEHFLNLQSIQALFPFITSSYLGFRVFQWVSLLRTLTAGPIIDKWQLMVVSLVSQLDLIDFEFLMLKNTIR